MRIRSTKVYKTMNLYHACEIAEGFGSGENATVVEQEAAWQWISDTGAWRRLQGFYGRTVHSMIRDGSIAKPK